ncbi:gliding motility-associated C-terminal domain-containing protein [Fulvivirgaceae bacterium PWU5]|uniref:Gliding motility-associated C-terminal domain-containing protein n=1 Tax=Dawidia cretensis TaxID=2782350 RepID=A0AAP2GVA9_9BACT|nr:PKD domain-containing protein [Dawidia cretensis]MBT1708717.1 gliding motility-associated C-terminal domain-containing protein [Dawidia cretensis]
MQRNHDLTVQYTYSDPDGSADASLYQWFRYDDNCGSNPVAIVGATAKIYRLTNADLGKHIGVRVTARDASGETGNVETFQPWSCGSGSGDPSTSNLVIQSGASCTKPDGTGSPDPSITLDAGDRACSPRTITLTVRYRGIDYTVPTNPPTIYVDWGDGPIQSYPATIVDIRETNEMRQQWMVQVNHTYDYDAGSTASTIPGERCTYTIRTSYGRPAAQCFGTKFEAVKVPVWDTEDNAQLGTFDVNHRGGTAGVEANPPAPLPGNAENVNVCEGDTSPIRLIDNTDFNCTPGGAQIENPNPNSRGRWMQWVYGSTSSVTAPGGVGGSIVINGVSYTAAQLPVYGRPFYQPQPFIGPATLETDDIRMPALANPNEQFVVSLRTWNTCNPFDRDLAVDGCGLNPAQGGTNNQFEIYGGTYQPGTSDACQPTPTGSYFAHNNPVVRNYTITVVDSPDPPVTSDILICHNGTRTLSVAPIVGLTYTWYLNATDALTATNAAGTGPTFTPSDAQAPAGASTRFWVTSSMVYPAQGSISCVSDTSIVRLSRRENMSAQPPALISPAMDVCPNTTYTYSLPNDPATETFGGATEFAWTITGAAAITGGQGTRQITILTNNVTVNSTFTLRVVRQWTTAPSCPSATREITVTIRPRPAPSIQPDPVTLCEGETVQINGNPNNPFGTIASHSWTGPSVGTLLDDPTVQQPNILTTASAGSYTLTYTIINSIGCSGTDNVNVVITPGLLNVSAGPNQNLCFTTPPLTTTLDAATPSAGTGTWSYVSGPDNTPTFTNVNLVDSDVTVDLPGRYVFEWEVASGSCTRASTVQIDFGREPAQPTAADRAFCSLTGGLSGSTPTFEQSKWSFVSGPGTVSFDDDKKPDAQVTATAYGAYQLKWEYSSGSGSGDCAPKSVTVNVVFSRPATATLPATGFITCVDETTLAAINLTVGSVGGAATQGRWEVVTGGGVFTSNNANPGAALAAGSLTDAYKPTAADFLAGAVTVRLVGIDPDGAGPCANVNSNNMIITLDRKPAAATVGAEIEVCAGNTVTLNATAATNNGTGTWTGTGGTITATSNPASTVTNLTAAGSPYTFTWTVTSAQNGNAGACAATTATVDVIIDPLPVLSTLQFNDLCETNEGTLKATGVTLADYDDRIVAPAAPGDRQVKWYASAIAQANDVSAITTYDISNNDILYIRVIDLTTGVRACNTLAQVRFSVSGRPVARDHSFFFCEEISPGGIGLGEVHDIDLTTAAVGDSITTLPVASRTITWYGNAVDAENGTNPIAANDIDLMANRVVYARIEGSSNTCYNVAEVSLIIKPVPAPPVITGKADPCMNSSELYTTAQVSGAKYIWTYPPEFTHLVGGEVGNSFLYLSFPSLQTKDITLKLVVNGCESLTTTKTITVSDDPKGYTIDPPAVVCEEGTYQFKVSTPSNGSTYNWEIFRQSDGAAGGGVVSNGQGTATVLINFESQNVRVKVTETNASNCPAATPPVIDVSVHANPEMDNILKEICSGLDIGVTLDVKTGSEPASLFNVQEPFIYPGINPVVRTFGNNQPGNALELDRYENKTIAQTLPVIYRVRPVSAFGCLGEERTATVNIKAEPVMDVNLSAAVCSDAEIRITLRSATGAYVADKFSVEQITYDAASLTPLPVPPATPDLPPLNTLVSDNAIYQNRWENITGASQQVAYRIRPYSSTTQCYGNPPADVIAVIRPKPLVTAVPVQDICSGETLAITLQSDNLTSPQFSSIVQYVAPLITGATNDNTGVIDDKLINGGTTLGQVRYSVTAVDPAYSTCVGPARLIMVNVRPAPTVANISKTVCSDVRGGDTYVEDLQALQPSAGLTYTWFANDGTSIPAGQLTAYALENNKAVTMHVVDPDPSSGCSKDVEVKYIVNPTPAVSAVARKTTDPRFNITCNGFADGFIDLSAQYGTNHTFSRDGSPYVPALFFSGLAAGTYVIHTRNAEGCEDDVSVAILAPDPIEPTVPTTTPVSCFNSPTPDGTIVITATGGTSAGGGVPLQFGLLQDPTVVYNPLTGSFGGLRANPSYTVVIRDQNGCQVMVQNIAVTQPIDLKVNANITSDYDGNDVSCMGATDGIITVLASDGTPGYTFVLDQDPTNTTGATSGIFADLAANILYTITAEDANGCKKTSIPRLLIEPMPLLPGVLGFDQNVCAGLQAAAFEELSQPYGGTGVYTYYWEESPDGTTFGPAAGANTVAEYEPPILATDRYYRRTVTSGTNPACPTEASETLKVTIRALPTSTLTSSTNAVCQGGNFTLDFKFPTGQEPFRFEYNDGTTTANLVGGVDRLVPIVNYTATHTYTLTKLVDFYGCEAVAFPAPVKVDMINVDANFTMTEPASKCSGSEYAFTFIPQENVTYTFNWNDGTPNTVIAANTYPAGVEITPAIMHPFTSANVSGNTQLPVMLTATSTVSTPEGLCTKFTSKTVTVYPRIYLNATADKTEMCSGDAITITNATIGGTSHEWIYRLVGTTSPLAPARPSGSSQSFTIVNAGPANPEHYEVVYTVKNANCQESAVFPIAVYESMTPSFTATATPFLGGNSFADFTNTSTKLDDTKFRYEWNFGDGSSPGTEVNMIPGRVLYTSRGTKTIELVMVNRAAPVCTVKYTDNLLISRGIIVADFTYTPQAVCFPATIEILENKSNGDIFEWTVTDKQGRVVNTSNEIKPIFAIGNSGEYVIHLKTTELIGGQPIGQSAEHSNDDKPVQIFENPFAAFEVVPDSIVFVPDNVGIEMRNYSLRASDYAWDFDDGATSIEIQPLHKYTEEGNYLVKLIATFNHGQKDMDGDGTIDGPLVCYDTATQTIIARTGGRIKIPNAFTPDQSGPNGGIGNGLFNDVFRPIMEGVEEFHMQIYDRWGNLIFESRDVNQGWDGYDKNGRLLPAGVYVYKITLRLSDSQRTTQVGDVTLIR